MSDVAVYRFGHMIQVREGDNAVLLNHVDAARLGRVLIEAAHCAAVIQRHVDEGEASPALASATAAAALANVQARPDSGAT